MRKQESGHDVIILPVENQVRELDAKLFLAAVAASRGYRVFIGSRAYIHFDMATYPQGVYIAKSMRSLSNRMFRIIDSLGHSIVAWEEEALVHPPADIFSTLRLSPGTLPYVSDIFCWGGENQQLLRDCGVEDYGCKLHITGNPRGDMLRPEFRPYFQSVADVHTKQFGDYVLMCTNFGGVNPYIESVGILKGPEKDKLGQAAKGMPLQVTQDWQQHTEIIFNAFLALIERIGKERSDLKLIVRPHPSEAHGPYQKIAQQFDNIEVINSGNVLPWILASKLVIQNGCTTGAESFALGVPTVSYMPVVDDYFDYEFHGFPNKLSEKRATEDEVMNAIDRPDLVLKQQNDETKRSVLAYNIDAYEGPFASSQIVDEIDKMKRPEKPTSLTQLSGIVQSNVKKTLTKLYMGARPGNNRLGYHDHRFPKLETHDLELRLEKMKEISGIIADVKVTQNAQHTFEIHPA